MEASPLSFFCRSNVSTCTFKLTITWYNFVVGETCNSVVTDFAICRLFQQQVKMENTINCASHISFGGVGNTINTRMKGLWNWYNYWGINWYEKTVKSQITCKSVKRFPWLNSRRFYMAQESKCNFVNINFCHYF